jgi:hypothetical protein
VQAIRKAFTDAGREVPTEFIMQRTSGARDDGPPTSTTP